MSVCAPCLQGRHSNRGRPEYGDLDHCPDERCECRESEATVQYFAGIFANIMNMDAEMMIDFCKHFDSFLDELADDDYFGTEGQLDPREDRRHWRDR